MNGYNFTHRVHKLAAQARLEAVRLHHEYVGTEHLLLALCRDAESVAASVLEHLQVSPEGLIRRVEQAVRPGKRPATVRAPDLPYTSRAKVVFVQALDAATELNHSYASSEHLLLGLIREERGIAAQVLSDAGVTLDGAQTELLRLLGVLPVNIEELLPLGPRAAGRAELTVHATDGRRFCGSFQTIRDAIVFLERLDRGERA